MGCLLYQVLVLGFLFGGFAHSGVNPDALDSTRFLEAESFQYEHLALKSDNGAFERYDARDKWGNPLSIVLTPTSTDIQLRLQNHVILSALGVSSIPAFPILIKRGFRGFPLRSELAQKGITPKPWAPEGAWLSGLVFPSKVVDGISSIDGLTAEQFGEALIYQLTAFVLHANGAAFALGNHGHIHGEVIGALRVLPSHKPKDVFRQHMRVSRLGRLLSFTERERDFLVQSQLLPFLDRVEALEEKHFATIMAPVFAHSGEALGRLLGTGAILPWRARFKLVRGFLETYLREKVGGVFRDVSLERKPGPKPELLVFDFAANQDLLKPAVSVADPIFRRKNAKRLLLAYYQAPNVIKGGVYRRWFSQIGHDPIEVLLEDAAAWDSSVAVTSSTRVPNIDFANRTPNHQFLLNHSAPRTMIIYSDLDQEGRAIRQVLEQIAHEVGAKPQLARVHASVGLSDDEIRLWIRIAVGSGIKRVIVVELGGVMQRLRPEFEAAGLELVLVDHHMASGSDVSADTSWNRLTALEQVARIYNYQTDLGQLAVAKLDAAGPLGLRHFMSRDDVDRFFRTTPVSWDIADAVKRSDFDQIPYFAHSKLSNFSFGIPILTFPEVKSFLMGKGLLHLQGDPELVMEVAKRFRGSWMVMGGDAGTSMYLILKVPNFERDHVRRTIREIAKNLKEPKPVPQPDKAVQAALAEALGCGSIIVGTIFPGLPQPNIASQ